NPSLFLGRFLRTLWSRFRPFFQSYLPSLSSHPATTWLPTWGRIRRRFTTAAAAPSASARVHSAPPAGGPHSPSRAVRPTTCRSTWPSLSGLGWHVASRQSQSTGPAGVAIGEDDDVLDRPIGLKQFAKLGFRGRIREISHKNMHAISPHGW